jgi:cytochrome P450
MAAPPAWLKSFTLSTPPPGFVQDPYPFYAALREHAPLHHLSANAVLLTRHADVLAVYRSPHASSDKQREFAPRLGVDTPIYEHHTTSLVFNDPPLHTRVRRILMVALNQRAVARMEADVHRLVSRLLQALEPMSQPDLIEHFAAAIPVEVIGNLLAIPQAERGPLRAWSLAILSALEPAPSAEVLAQANRAVTEFCDYLRGLVRQRRLHPGDANTDVLTRLLQGDDQGGELSEAELLHNCIFLLNAGHETTTNLIGNGVHALLCNPEQWRRLVAHPNLISTAIEELLRFESPLQLNNRLATADLHLPSGVVPAGCFVTLAIGAANHDPHAFDAPARLDIARKPNNHLAFGQGAHACSGMNVARLEARVAIGQLIARFAQMGLVGVPLRDTRVRFRGFKKLTVKLQ